MGETSIENMNSNLLDYRRDKYSQAGQDGIIERIFNVLRITKGCFVEFGAWDGIYLSNCRKLFEEGWSGVFIEADSKKFSELQKNYAYKNRVTCLNKMVEVKGENRLDNILDKYTPRNPIDFISIDVDGPDLEMFESIEKYLPAVVCIEGGKGAHPFDPRMPVHCISNIGQSLKVIRDSAEKKGYKILCSFQDTFLIKERLVPRFNPPTDLLQLYINGCKAPDYSQIPMFVERLKSVHRENKILDHILEETKYYSKYKISSKKDRTEWARENEQRISDILMSLPRHLF